MSIDKSYTWMMASNALIDGIGFVGNERNRIAISLLHLSNDHQKGIHLLIDNELASSAFALLRPQFEALVRGLWFHRCATEKEIEKFLKKKEPPRINDMIQAIEETHAYSHGSLSALKSKIWKLLNDFTHGGLAQVLARNTDEQIISNYSLEQMNALLDKSVDISLVASIETALIAENSELSIALKELHVRVGQ